MASIEQGQDAAVRTLTLNRPEVLNAFDQAMLEELRSALRSAVDDPAVRAIVLTGGARAFSTGEDLRAAQRLDGPAFRAQIETLQRLASELRDSPTPVIAAIAGPAFGGGLELAVNCDVRVAAASARFACPETRWALTITNGASLLLRRLVGEGWAREIALLGTEVDAQTALRIGLVTRVVADEDLGPEAARLAARVVDLDPDAVAATKRLLNADPAPWASVLDAELEEVVRGFASPAVQARLAEFGEAAVTALVLDALLAERAGTHADRVFLRFREGELTFAQVDADATAMAHGLARLGVAPGALIASLLPNCLQAAVLPFAVARRGAVLAPINTAFRGRVLAHALNLSRAEVLVLDDTLADAVAQVAGDLQHLRRVLVRGDAGAVRARLPGVEVLPLAVLRTGSGMPLGSPNAEDDLALLLFTSGTTGRSKGCMLSHRYGPRQAQLMIEHYELRADDVLYCPFPLFHLDALVLTVLPALELGATAAIGARFSASGFWDEIRAFGATVFDFMGATLTMLHKRPPEPGERDNPVRLAWGVPVPEWAPAFERRFDLKLVELYGSTDVGVPIYQPLHEPRVVGSCGRAIAAYDVRLLDDSGDEVPAGVAGEIAVRAHEPGLLSDGYYGMSEATAAARRDGWFLTGDFATRDAAANIFFVGRRTEAIRRRGENISAFEVEEVVLTHPDVLDAAAYGVPSELSEEEVMVAVVARPGHTVDPAGLVAHCAANMARYMVPRYVDVLDALPLTPTAKVEKYRLVERGITPTTWDREA